MERRTEISFRAIPVEQPIGTFFGNYILDAPNGTV